MTIDGDHDGHDRRGTKNPRTHLIAGPETDWMDSSRQTPAATKRTGLRYIPQLWCGLLLAGTERLQLLAHGLGRKILLRLERAFACNSLSISNSVTTLGPLARLDAAEGAGASADYGFPTGR
jgi:hypothetical protein